MKIASLVCLLFILGVGNTYAQDSTKIKRRNKINETIQNLPDILIAQPAGPDSLMYFLKNDNMVLTVFPIWQEKGTQMGTDLKLDKINEDPFDGTFPLPEKKLANGLRITMTMNKKSVDERTAMLKGQIKPHLQALYKDGGRAATADEVTQQVNSMISGPEDFTTDEGKKGQIYYMQDFNSQQISFEIALIIPGTKPGTSALCEFTYYKYFYDTDLPNDINELKVFGYPDDEKTYITYTKNFFKTLKMPQ